MNQTLKARKFGDLDITKKSSVLLSKLQAYGQIHFDKLIDEFVECFEDYCTKVVKMQEIGIKEPISFINFSVLRTNLLIKKHELRIDAYGEDWYLDRIECAGSYDVSKMYRWLDTFADSLEATRKKYMGNLKLEQMQEEIFHESQKYLIFVAEIMRIAIKKAIKTQSYQKMKRNDVFVICIGEYQDQVDILYKEDSTIKDGKAVKRYFEKDSKQNDLFTYEICRDLNLSEGNFTDINIMYSSFTKCDFTNANFKDSALFISDFKQSIFKDVSFENVQLLELDFTEATLENVSFKDAKLTNLIFKNATLINVDFEDALIISGLSFEDAALIETVIPKEKGLS